MFMATHDKLLRPNTKRAIAQNRRTKRQKKKTATNRRNFDFYLRETERVTRVFDKPTFFRKSNLAAVGRNV